MATTKTFRSFVRDARQTYSIAGDLLYDLKRDHTLPETFGSLEQMRTYLGLHRACPEAMQVAPQVWRRYLRWRAKA